MNPKRTWASLLIGLLAIQFSGCASLPGWMSASNSTSHSAGRNIQTQFDIARLHEHQKNLIQAREMYLKILDHNPQNVQAYHRLGVVWTRLGKPDEAMLYYQRAVELDPDNSDLLSDFGYALFLNDDSETAVEALEQALALDPNHKRSIGNLAMVRGYQGHFKKCLSLFREVVPESKAYANLAYIHAQRGEGQLAIKRYAEALELNNNLESAAEALVQIAKLQNRVEDRAPRLENHSAPNSYVAAAENYESFDTGTAATQIEPPRTETQRYRETESPTPGQWWNDSADLVLTGATTESIPEDEFAAEEFPADELSVDEASVDQIASDKSSTEIYPVAERSSGEDPVNEFPADEFAADEFVPAPHPLADNSQNDQFESEIPGRVRIGSHWKASDDDVYRD
jgi:Tfp pilus assembly protein PilF